MPQSLRPALKKALGPDAPSDARPVVVLGVGSPLRSDDAAGLHVAAGLTVELRRRPCAGLTVIEAGPAPENFTSEIRRIRPAVVLLVDCARMGEVPGTLRVIEPEQIAGVSFGTHGLPLSVLAEFLRQETGCSVTFLGIEPQGVDHGETLSAAARAGVETAVSLLSELLLPDRSPPGRPA
ncbi:MAG TPA: hydrogenase 3 maturation endopeptidase HyCI [Spirochaetia bacterium]|nr:hydrogenase 3 maturation endopeptidase HyCI [Spirochaetia bacterium]